MPSFRKQNVAGVYQSDSSAFSRNLTEEENEAALQSYVDLPAGAIIGSQVTVNDISVTTLSGQKVSLLGTYKSIRIDESMFSFGVIGSIELVDLDGGIEKFAFRGGETLTIKLSKPNNNEIIVWREDLVVHKISKHDASPETTTDVYSLIFSSKSYLLSLKKNVFKTFKNKPLAEAVAETYSLMSGSDIYIEDPKITIPESKPFISTGMSPHKILEEFAKKACSTKKFFVFFERFIPIYGSAGGGAFASTHFFGSTDKIIEDTPNPPSIFYTTKNIANLEGSRIRGINFKRLTNFNHVEALLHGHYNSKIYSIDLTKRTYDLENQNYLESDGIDFYDNKLMDSANFFGVYNDLEEEIQGRRVITKNDETFIDRNQWLKTFIDGMLTKNMMKVSIEIRGGTNRIGVGQIINLYVPSTFQRVANPTLASVPYDMIYSGKYFVTGATHFIRSNIYTKKLELGRGSLPFNFDSNSVNAGNFFSSNEDFQREVGNIRTK